VIADVPGLIEGASEGKGLGLQFLRHVERCSALLHVIDCATLEPMRDPITDLDKILHELNAYQVPDGELPLTQRPQLIALNKADVPEARELAEFVKPELEARGYRVFIVSAATREGLRELNFALAQLVEQERKTRAAIAPVLPRITLMQSRRDESKFTVTKEMSHEGEFFRIVGVKPERWVAQTQFGNDEAVGYLGDRLFKIGVEEALFKAGASAGSTVVIGPGQGVLFDWEPSIASAGELIGGRRGEDIRIDQNPRRTTNDRRASYKERMDLKAEIRAEMEKERKAGVWSKPEDFKPQSQNESLDETESKADSEQQS
jgi:GTP-binding protein